ncbi:hypothetical protein ACWGDX_19265 [Streptomyces sp. NPDC055025]
MSAGLIGCMTTPAQGAVIPPAAEYACDNGKFGKGWPGHDAWYAWLERTVERYGTDRCLWAVAPDVPFDAAGTLTESLPWLPRIRALGIPAAFAAQNGCDLLGIPWHAFDVLFIAGSTEWKIGPVAERLAREAKTRGKGVHMGRVNSLRRMGIAEWFGCGTADGTYLAFGPDKNLPRLLRWVDELDRHPSLAAGHTEAHVPTHTAAPPGRLARHEPRPGAILTTNENTVTPTDLDGCYVHGHAVLHLTDQLNAATSYERAAELTDQVLHPTDGLLERLADFAEAAAEKARESDHEDGFDLHDDFEDAAASLRGLSEDLHTAVERMRALGAPPRQSPQARIAASYATTATALPPQPAPPAARPRHPR